MNFYMSLANFLFFIIATLAFAHFCDAQNSPQDYVDAHNAARAEVGVGDVEWSDEVAAYAQDYANQRMNDCALQHSEGGPYGENIVAGPGDASGLDAVKMWVDEKANYDYDSNTCAPNEMCGHYTQVVWRDTISIGCARVLCNGGGIFITCNYDPRGNYPGQKPY